MRSEVIIQRSEYSHSEMDTVILTLKSKQYLLVLTNCRTRHQLIRLISNK